MDMQEFIPVKVFCLYHNIELSFISSLQEFNLIEVIDANHEKYLRASQLPEAEKIIRLHHDLAINTEGVDVVLHLLQKIKTMQQEIQLLKNKLGAFDTEAWPFYNLDEK